MNISIKSLSAVLIASFLNAACGDKEPEVEVFSPHMLNQEEGASNILLAREIKRGKVFETVRVDTSGENWMAPFADHLGISSEEFTNLKPLFSADKSKVLLVEGPIDQEYFQFLQKHTLACDQLAVERSVARWHR